MKKYNLFAVVFVVTIAAVCLIRPFVHRDKPLPEDVPDSPELYSFECVTLQVIGMRFDQTYEILNQETGVRLSRYHNVYENGEDVQKLDKTVICNPDEILELLRACQITAWDGFHGEHPKGVKDGDMFSFMAVVNDGIELRATGSANYPIGYHDLVRTMDRMLAE